jgi:hypothetical protein
MRQQEIRNRGAFDVVEAPKVTPAAAEAHPQLIVPVLLAFAILAMGITYLLV